MAQQLQARCFFPILVVAALLGTVHTILPCALLLLPLPLAPLRRAYRAAVCFVARAWFTLAASLLEAESAVRVTGDAPPASDRTVLLVCNHNSRVDWMYVWVLAARFGVAERLKIALKDSLRRAPLFGWAMQAFLFVFLSRRDRDADLGTLRSVLSYCAHSLREPTAFLLFPEGTDLSASNLEKSREWAAKRGVAPFDHLLLPREAGFVETVRAFGGALDAVYDVTVRYSPGQGAASGGGAGGGGGWRPSELEMARGVFPGAVELHVRRFARGELPLSSDEALGGWLQERWAAKEAWLAARAAGGPEAEAEAEAAPAPLRVYAAARLAWAIAVAAVGAALWHRPLARWLTALGCMLLALATSLTGGLGVVEMATAPAALRGGRDTRGQKRE